MLHSQHEVTRFRTSSLPSLLTGFIYRLNQPYRGSQSLFSNVSIYDDNFLNEIMHSYCLEIDEEIYKAKIDIVKNVQNIFINIMNNEMRRKPITFPITTACISVDDNGNINLGLLIGYIIGLGHPPIAHTLSPVLDSLGSNSFGQNIINCISIFIFVVLLIIIVIIN